MSVNRGTLSDGPLLSPLPGGDAKYNSVDSLDTIGGGGGSGGSAAISVPVHSAVASNSGIAGSAPPTGGAHSEPVVVTTRQFSMPIWGGDAGGDESWMAVPPLPTGAGGDPQQLLLGDAAAAHASSWQAAHNGLSTPLMSPAGGGGEVDPLTPHAATGGILATPDLHGTASHDGSTPKPIVTRSRAPSLNLTVRHSETKSSLAGASFNLFNDVLSAGFVGMASFFAQSGIVLGPIVMAIYGVLSFSTLMLEAELLERHKLSSYAEMCYRAFGRRGYIVANCLMFLFNWGSFLVPMIILGTVLPTLLTGWFGHHAGFDRHIVLGVTLLLFSPLAFYKVRRETVCVNERLSVCRLIDLTLSCCYAV